MAGPCEHGNEPLDSIKFWEFIESEQLLASKGLIS
jgi:hypothetical protein